MRVVYFGTYERGYPRNAQVISCLRGAGVEVVERHVSVWDGSEHKFAAGLGSALRRARESGKPSLINVWIDPDVFAPGTMNQTMYK